MSTDGLLPSLILRRIYTMVDCLDLFFVFFDAVAFVFVCPDVLLTLVVQ